MSAKIKPRGLAFFAAALFLLAGAGAFAYDGAAWGGLHGKLTRAAFSQAASEIDAARGALLVFLEGGLRIERLVPIGANDADKEDLRMLLDLEAFIAMNFEVAGGEGFSHVIRRGATSAAWDGWVVFSHYDSAGWLHYVYYFVISAENSLGAQYYYGTPVDV